MATKSFTEKVVVKDQKVVQEMKNDLMSDDYSVFIAAKRTGSCTSKSTEKNSKKWIL